MLKIAHIAKYTHNIGEGALIHGIHETFKEDVSKDAEFTAFDRKNFQAMHGHELALGSVAMRVDCNFVEHVNQHYDLLMIGGGGVFQTGEYDQVGGMAIAGDLDALAELKRPLVVYGVGDNRFSEANAFSYADELLRLIEYVRGNGYKFSFRDDGSCERLSQLVSAPLDRLVDVIPDPGLFMKLSIGRHPLVSGKYKTILFQVAGDRVTERLSIADLSDDNALVDFFVRQVVDALFQLSQQYDARIILAPHVPSDYALITKIIEVASEKRLGHSGFMRERITVNYCSAGFDGAPDFFSLYSLVDLVIGMRFHSVVCAVGLGVPCVAIDTMPKVGRFMDKFGLGDYVVSASDLNLAKSLHSAADHILSSEQEWMSIRDASINKAREEIRRFNRACAEII